jgi:FixJ family two-component response regulator
MQHSDTALSIAIIEPDEASRVSLTRLLLAHGYRPLPFPLMSQYADHIHEIGAAPLMLADVHEYLNMPTGQRKSLLGGSIVITLANDVRIRDIGKALVAGCIDYLVRPIPSTLLLATIAQATSRLRVQ